MILGAIIIAIALFSYLPSTWNTVLYVVIAFFIITAAYLMKPEHIPAKPKAPYIEHASAMVQDSPVTPLPSAPINNNETPPSL
jgi:hypothetical protein